MTKPSRAWFGSRSSSVTVIEAPVRLNYRRRSAMALFVTWFAVTAVSATVFSSTLHPIVGLLAGVVVGFVTGLMVGVLVMSWPVLRVFWHWLPEILLLLSVGWCWQLLVNQTPPWLTLLVASVVVGVPVAVGAVRRRLIACGWCLVVRHRLRLCFASFVTGNRYGTLPLVLPAWPTPAGERVLVWLRPGLSLKELETDGLVQKLAVACWASEVRVVRASKRYAALVQVDIARRDPLATPVISPLPDYLPDEFPANAPVSPAVPDGVLDLPDIPDTNPDPAAGGSRRRGRPIGEYDRNTPPRGVDPNSDYA